MAEEIRLDITSVAHNKGLTDAARETRSLRSEADRLTGTLGKLEDGSFSLDKALADTRIEAAKLRAEFAATGDTTLFGDIRRQQATINNLQKIKEAIEEVAEATAEVSAAAGGGTLGGAGGNLFDLGPSKVGSGPVIAGVIAGLAPQLAPLGAMIAGTVAGTIGTGGVAGGILMASKDPGVRAAARQFGKNISDEFFSGGDAFVGPAVRSMRLLENAFGDMNIGDTFAKMAPHVTTIAAGLGDLGRNVMPGLDKAFGRMGPFAEVAAEGFGELGGAIGQFADDVTASEGAVQGLDLMLKLLSGGIIFTGQSLKLLSDAYSVYLDVQLAAARVGQRVFASSAGMASFFTSVEAQLTGIKDTSTGMGSTVNSALGMMTKAVEVNAEGWLELQEAMEQVRREQMDWLGIHASVPQAAADFEESIDELTEALKRNGAATDISTEKGRATQAAFQDAFAKAREHADAVLQLTGNVDTANASYATEVARLEAIANQAGITKEQLKKMMGTYEINVVAKANNLLRTLLSGSLLSFANIPGIVSGARAAGGPVSPFGTYVVGEKGPEVLQMGPQGGYVHPNSSMGGITWAAPIVLPAGNTVDITALREEIAARGGTLAVLGIRS